MQELAKSLKANGLLQPITVSEQADGYIILMGHRRFLAAQKAGWTEIDCIVQNHFSDEIERIITQAIENEDREEISAGDKEAAVLKLETDYKLSAEEICKRFGKSRGWHSQIKGAHEFRKRYGKLFEEAEIPLYTKEAYKMKEYSEEQVKQVIESLKSGDSKAGVLSETEANIKKETRGSKPKQKTEAQSMEAGTSIVLI